MARRFTSTVQVNCWKQHTCSGCGANYSYLLSRKAVGSSTTAEKARAAMQRRVAWITGHDNDMQPCPGCGMYQYDMIGQRRAKSRIQFFWIAAVCMTALLITKLLDGLGPQLLNWIGIAVCGLLVLFHLLLELSNANRDLAANQALGQQRASEGKIRFTPGTGLTVPQSVARPPRTMMHNLALVVLLASMGFVVIPEAARTVFGWPINSECYPPVVGASDRTRFYLSDSIHSIKGFWRGDPHVLIHYQGGPAEGETLAATSNQNSWGSTISDVKSEDKSSTSHPWVEMTMPDLATLAGKAVSCDIDLSVEYPRIRDSDSNTFETTTDEMRQSFKIVMAPRGAGAQYNSLWWMGVGGGAALLVLGSLMLYRQALASKKLAQPTVVLPPQPPRAAAAAPV